jgi:isopenicillin N synthase-like dioxygenase
MPALDIEAPKTIPIVDISAFIDDHATPQSKDDVVKAMSHACSTYGFFYLVGHGIPEADRQQILDCARLFASLPMNEKMDISVSKCIGQSFRGYEPPALQLHQEGLLPDTKEVGGRLPRSIL